MACGALVLLSALVLDERRSVGGEQPAATRAAGMEAHIDPATGRFVPEPVVPRAPAPAQVPPPIVVEPAPGGGMMSVLHGRFRSSIVATVDADGTLHMDCHPENAPVESPQP